MEDEVQGVHELHGHEEGGRRVVLHVRRNRSKTVMSKPLEKERQLFESWATSHRLVLTPAPMSCIWPDYYNGVTQACWDAWQAGQAKKPVVRRLRKRSGRVAV